MPSYLSQTGSVEDMIHGVNYASAGAGIIFSSGSQLVCLPLPLLWIIFSKSRITQIYQTLIIIHHWYNTLQGQRISLTQQIQQFTDTYQQFIINMGEDAAAHFISNSVFYISVGINDYIHYYLPNISNVQNVYLPWAFNKFLAYTLKQEIKVIMRMLCCVIRSH